MLGIFGDSFSDSNEYPVSNICTPSWPVQLSKKLNLVLHNYSFSGTSLWYSYKHFIENYKKFTHIVYTYTEANRWNSITDELKRFSSIYTREKLDKFPTISSSEYTKMKKLINVHHLLFDETFNNFILQEIFNSVNSICKQHNIKLVNIFPFYEKTTFDLTDSCGTCLLNLMNVSENEICTPSKLYGNPLKHPEFDFFRYQGDSRRNHLSPKNNLVMTDIILEEFEQTEGRIIDLFEDKRFDYDVQILLDYKKQLEQ